MTVHPAFLSRSKAVVLVCLFALSMMPGCDESSGSAAIRPDPESSGQDSLRTPGGGHWDAVARGKALLSEGRPRDALQAVAHVRDEGEGAGEALTVAGIALYRMGEFVHARRSLEKALEIQPDQPETARALAALCLSLGDSVRGLEALRLAAKFAPEDTRPWLDMAHVYHERGEFDQAADAYREAQKRSPRSRDAILGLIEELIRANRASEANRWIDAGVHQWPDDSRLLGLAARHAQELGQAERARVFLDRCLAADPGNSDALLARARLRRLDGKPELALEDVREVVERRPNDLAALQLLGQIQSQLGRTEEAAATIERHRQAHDRSVEIARLTAQVADKPDDPALRLQIGQLAEQGGSLELARHCYAAALRLDPGYQPARDRLAALDAAAEGISDGEPSEEPVP